MPYLEYEEDSELLAEDLHAYRRKIDTFGVGPRLQAVYDAIDEYFREKEEAINA